MSDAELRTAVRDVVEAQRRAGVDIVNEGELTKGGSWVVFISSRFSGFPPGATANGPLARRQSRLARFDDFYKKALEGGTLFEQTRSAPNQTASRIDWVCTGPIRYTGEAALKRELDLLRSSLGPHDAADAFITTTAPASVEVGRANEHYASEEEFVYALAEALRVDTRP